MAHEIRLHLRTLLSSLENELQQLGWWQQQEPNIEALQSQQPFCVDTLEFAQWLQWVFVPRMQSILDSEHALPSQCAIYEMAEVVYREQRNTVATLLDCLKCIDVAIMTQHRFN
jgi:uncharacterized protein YqcC (DUF446 family)